MPLWRTVWVELYFDGVSEHDIQLSCSLWYNHTYLRRKMYEIHMD